jgi:phosphoglycerate dehydrogenase-like enzyme
LPRLLLLVKPNDIPAYLSELKTAGLADLEIVTTPDPSVEIILGDPALFRAHLRHLPALRWVQATWAGIESLLDPALRHDYILTNARGVFGPLMSEYVFSYLLLYERRILERLEAQKHNQWAPALTGTLRGKTIGLLGVGSIGAHVAGTAKHFGMKVRGYTRASQGCPDIDRYYHGEALLEFATGLDVLVNVLPNTPATHSIVNADVLNSLADQAIFINAGRGSAVDEAALLSALRNKQLAAAVLDVFREEPLPHAHPFWNTENLFITSHTAAPSFAQDLARLFIENYRLFIAKQALKFQVNFEQGY